MIYLLLDNEGYLAGTSDEPVEGVRCQAVESVELEHWTQAYRWDGEKLVLDEQRLAQIEAMNREAVRSLTDGIQLETVLREAQAALVTAQINTLAVDDATALRWRALYPAWAAGVEYKAGEKVRREDRLYRCLQGHTSQAGWEPETAASLWTEICESHAGTVDDPIPYGGNMALEAGKFYSQDGVTYRCTRDTGIPVYNPLSELVGLYVEVAA